MKKIAWTALFAVAFAAGLLVSRAPARMPAASNELEKVGAFLGKWNSTGEMKDTPYSKAQKNADAETTCNWAPNHGFLVCDQMIHGPAGVENDLSIYTYNEKQHAFAFFGLSRNDPNARTTKLTIEGNLWTYSGGFDDGAKHIQFRTTNKFTSPATVVWRSEYSEDGAHWILMGEGTESRVN